MFFHLMPCIYFLVNTFLECCTATSRGWCSTPSILTSLQSIISFTNFPLWIQAHISVRRSQPEQKLHSLCSRSWLLFFNITKIFNGTLRSLMNVWLDFPAYWIHSIQTNYEASEFQFAFNHGGVARGHSFYYPNNLALFLCVSLRL